MVKIRSFKGYLPQQEKYKSIVSPPYDVLSRQEAMEKAKQTPWSFLHINKPQIDVEEAKDNPYCQKVYEKGRQNLLQAIQKGWLVQDKAPRMYIYSMKMGDHLQKGIVCLASVDDYENDKIKKHEQTLPKKQQDRTKLADVQGANAGPVFVTYPQNKDVRAIIDNITTQQEPRFNMIGDDDQVEHKVWLISQQNSKALESLFEAQVPQIYIADGHHRAKAAFNVGKIRKQRADKKGLKITGEQDFNFFMTILFADDNLLCMDYNRLVKSINDMSSQEFIAKVKDGYNLKEVGKASQFVPKTTKHGHSFMLIDKKWYSMEVKCNYQGEAVEEEKKQPDPVKSLDVQILTDRVLNKILGVQDIKTDPRIDFVGGIRGYKELEKRCQEECKVAFLMHPVGLDQIMKVANAGRNMPPKSTWFEPKPKSGFVVRVFEDQKKED